MRRRGSPSAAVFATALMGNKAKEYEAGQTIVSQGEECTDVYYIEKGVVKLTLVSNRGKGAVLGILGPGDFFGEACIGGDAVFSTSAIALVPSVVNVIKRKSMIRLVEENPSLSAHFINYLLTRNRRIEQDLIDHMFNFSEKRLARTLLLLARGGKDGEVAPILEKIGQDTLAEMVGTTRSRVNFFMNKFRKQGFIHYNGGLKVHDTLASVLHE
ncbi:MAG TPA: Crp/Fnr family transcriptional regulator [Candidatus Sulfotelmatobacter sp.]|nr:Crp/Fnr family transcriptional regulator [Candidatus Sulfotelmatobacter sp.]